MSVLLGATGVGLAFVLLLLAADHLGQQHRCHRLNPSSYAYSVYCTPEGPR